jgi:glucose-1-phosphate cytidylyltransferase
MEKPKVVILCGGKGTRMQEETEFKPKPLVEVGGRPILWHIMKIYSHYGFNDFVLCLGYRGYMIKDFFLKYNDYSNDFRLNLKSEQIKIYDSITEDWNITFADTGLKSQTGSRIKRIEKYIDEDNFFMTYGDGVSDINIKKLLEFHNGHKKIGTVTAVRPLARFGMLKLDGNNIKDFTKENLMHDGRIDGGFCVFKKDFFDYLDKDESCVLEKEPLQKIAKEDQFMAYKHDGFWQCMDTRRHVDILNGLWETDPKWKVWK